MFSRWFRLLFAREFHIQDVLRLWDAIFADDKQLNITDYMALAMLLFLREQRTALFFALLVLLWLIHVIKSDFGRLYDVSAPPDALPAR